VSFVGQLRKPKQDKTKQAERRQRAKMAEIKELAEAVHDMAQTDKDVETLNDKLRDFTEIMNNGGTPLMNFFQKMSPLDITMLLTDVASTSNMTTRTTYITHTVLPEAKRIAIKIVSLQETLEAADKTVELAYQQEFAVGRGGGRATGLIPCLKDLVDEKTGKKQAGRGHR
jgi:hypothetical protein